jgi:mannose-1-phosphate guanylyltransferase
VQAVILVGGEGTRLRPLTTGTPKPIVTFVDRPFMGFMLEWLSRHGVDDVIMSCGFLATKVKEVLGDGSRFGVSLRFVEEPEPRGTAGALKYAEEYLQDRFLMLNGDTLTDLDVTAQVRRHVETGAVATLGLIPVEDPSAYGLVLENEGHTVRGFLEKPGPDQLEGIDDYLVSGGVYVLERRVLDMIPPDRNVSIEREVWPALVGNGLYAFAHRDAYWLDIGTPDRYLKGTADILEGHVKTAVGERLNARRQDISGDVQGIVTGPAIVERGAVVAKGARIVGPAVIDADVHIAPGATIERSVVLRGTRVEAGAHVRDAILAPHATIGERTVVEGEAVVGEGVRIGADCTLARGIKVFPGTTLPDGAIKF